ncbi:MAG: Kazal-type serine protease inhibitor, partial [Candidatus Woesearchaeota archaeon]|nr:Kazal-type serine protease inhibitor [Candidatus Woesearchaeota archaeon]
MAQYQIKKLRIDKKANKKRAGGSVKRGFIKKEKGRKFRELKFFVYILLLIFIVVIAKLVVTHINSSTEIKEVSLEETGGVTTEGSIQLCNCPNNFEPVCADNKTYKNSCFAECAGIREYADGECHTPDGLPFYSCGPTTGGVITTYNPVCAKIRRIDKGDYIWRTFTNIYT